MFQEALEIRSKHNGPCAVAISKEGGGGFKPGEKPALAWACDFLSHLPECKETKMAIVKFYLPETEQIDPEPTSKARREFWKTIRATGIWKEGLAMVRNREKRE